MMEISRTPNCPNISGTTCKDVYFYGTLVTPAQLNDAGADIFLSNRLHFSKPRWVPDEDAYICYHCAVKFTAVRRKHHCRQCGRVFCSRCCSHKMQLQHLSYQSLERVCILCQGYVTLLFKAQSLDPVQKLEAITGFEEICQSTRAIIPFIEMGGVIAVLYVAREKDVAITTSFLKAVNILASHQTLHNYIASTGTIRLLIKKFIDADRNQHPLLCDIISLIRMLCLSESVKLLALQEGVVDALVPYCNMNVEPVCLPALECLSVVCSHSLVYNTIVDNKQCHTLARLLILATSEDEKVQDVALQILAQISSGTEWHRQRLVEEDIYNGGLLAEVLTYRPNCVSVLNNVTCLVANLASDEISQGVLSDHLMQLCRLLDSLTDGTEALKHAARGLANFSKFRNNCEILMESLEVIIAKLMHSTDAEVRHHGCQIVVALLGFCTSACVQILERVGPAFFLEYLGYNNEAMNALKRTLNGKLPMVVCPGSNCKTRQ